MQKNALKFTIIAISTILLYLLGHFQCIFLKTETLMFTAITLFTCITCYYISEAKRGAKIFLRPIAGIEHIDEAVGRATEMGKPILFVPGIMDLDQVETLAGLIILEHVATLSAQYETKLNVPVSRSLVMEAARETCQNAYTQVGRPDLYQDDMVNYLTDDQFGYAAGVDGYMVREKPATCFYQGKFYAESLILAETGNSIGAIQIAGTGSPSQIPFFVVACDYTLIGEEFFVASAYFSENKNLLGTIKGQDIFKALIIVTIVITIINHILVEFNLISFNLSEFIRRGH